ncbi:glycosyltransferase family 4 protein [Maribacter sp. Asnod1-A12]|uniref:glycosyltransferase family 4 protein n=1 Tax=Maribacter sp. Asnod1-A12 TaxID=3160576 RepID=UPI0038653321
MKKLHLISAMYSSKGHGREYIRNMCCRLEDFYSITLHIASDKILETPEGIETNYLKIDYSKTDANNFVKFSIFAPYIRAITKQYFSFCYYKKILKSELIREGDLVYIMDYDVIPLVFLIKGLKRKKTSKVFLWIHSAKFKSRDIIYSIYKSIFKVIFNHIVFSNITAIVVNGKYIKTEILKNLKISQERIHIIQYPSEILFKKIPKDIARERLNLNKKDKIILFFGMLRKDKNIELLIKSVSEASILPKLIIAGSEASVTRLEIENWIEKYNLENYILDIDYISEEKMSLYYSCSDLLMLTYELESGSQSGPLSLAREFELPSLVSNVGEIGKYVEENNVGLTADPNIEADFTKKINIILDNDFTLKDSLRSAKEKYSWESASLKYRNLFDG